MKKHVCGMLMIAGACIGLLTGCNSGTKMKNYADYVTLGQYIGVEYTPLSTTVTEEELQAQVDNCLQQWGDTVELTEGTVKDGDTINLDYIGYVDGEAFEGGSTDGAGTSLTIGSHQYIDDFEEQLIGHDVGEEGIEVNVTFPDDYKNSDNTISDLAGKDATFVCTINSIYQTTYPDELTDELVAENTDYETVNAFMDALKMDYENYKKERADQQMKVDLIVAVMDNATVQSYPEKEMSELTEQTIQAAKDGADAYGMEYTEYLNLLQDEEGNPYTEETYRADVEEYIQELLKEKMVVCMIADAEHITATKNEVQEYVEAECAANTSLNEETIYESYSMEELAYAVIYDKVIDFLADNAIAIEE